MGKKWENKDEIVMGGATGVKKWAQGGYRWDRIERRQVEWRGS